ncbi:GntR family transcriptional regulator [Bosea sp. Root381]|uniref:GntR family transcriptional regulator n=1 Tax=Bosea sp. Root381 TaxID=1736524 RepID=UPI0006F8F09B|nr:GntR family transcriptional regulator [Bosea sp. Root381]KRE03536.1 GntR family transcriptional regulator [Bosea sp. Root381]
MAKSRKPDLSELLAAQLLGEIREQALAIDTHLRTQDIASRLGVSRFPVGQALGLLAEKGVLRHERNRGYFVASAKPPTADELGLSRKDLVAAAYFQIADDHLRGLLPGQVTELDLRERYDLTKTELAAVLTRISSEGWAERRPGYGWSFVKVLTTPESLEQTYRLRLALEPAALLEPTYHIAPEVIASCRLAEERLLKGAIETDSADELHERGVRFHEAIVGASGNPFFLDTVRRLHRIRRLLSYRSMLDRKRYRAQCEEHLAILDSLAKGDQSEAADRLRAHLLHTIENYSRIRRILTP